jgi:hypothetical protein
MRIPVNAFIAQEKLTQYLLVERVKNDKAKFLAAAGFTLRNPDALRLAIERLIFQVDAIEDDVSDYGIFYRVEGDITNSDMMLARRNSLSVVTIWLSANGSNQFRFITLKPKR